MLDGLQSHYLLNHTTFLDLKKKNIYESSQQMGYTDLEKSKTFINIIQCQQCEELKTSVFQSSLSPQKSATLCLVKTKPNCHFQSTNTTTSLLPNHSHVISLKNPWLHIVHIDLQFVLNEICSCSQPWDNKRSKLFRL